jgi:hypothetical protein
MGTKDLFPVAISSSHAFVTPALAKPIKSRLQAFCLKLRGCPRAVLRAEGGKDTILELTIIALFVLASGYTACQWPPVFFLVDGWGTAR